MYQILSDGSGKSFFKNIEIFEGLLFGKREEGFFKFQLFFLIAVHIAAADAGDSAVFRRKLFADFQNFFFVHNALHFYLLNIFA